MALRVRVLGPIEVMTADGPVAVMGRQGALLAMLAARAGAVVLRRSAGRRPVGPGLPDDPSNALQGLVSRLRSRLGADLIETRSSGYRLGVPPDEVDVLRFEELLRRADGALASVAIGLIDDALALWRGQAFGEHGDLVALRAETSRLEELLLVASERRLRRLIEVGRLDEAISSLEAFVLEHPLREAALASLMEALARAGRKTEALRRLSAYRSMLAEESGLEPSAALLISSWPSSPMGSTGQPTWPTDRERRLRRRRRCSRYGCAPSNERQASGSPMASWATGLRWCSCPAGCPGWMSTAAGPTRAVGCWRSWPSGCGLSPTTVTGPGCQPGR